MATKLYVPLLRRSLVPCPRLALLQRGRETRLTLVSAPAALITAPPEEKFYGD